MSRYHEAAFIASMLVNAMVAKKVQAHEIGTREAMVKIIEGMTEILDIADADLAKNGNGNDA